MFAGLTTHVHHFARYPDANTAAITPLRADINPYSLDDMFTVKSRVIAAVFAASALQTAPSGAQDTAIAPFRVETRTSG